MAQIKVKRNTKLNKNAGRVSARGPVDSGEAETGLKVVLALAMKKRSETTPATIQLVRNLEWVMVEAQASDATVVTVMRGRAGSATRD